MKLTGLILSLVGASLTAGCGSPPPPATEEAPIAVSIGRAEAADLPSVFEAGGLVRARLTAAIASRVMAPVAAVHVGPGDLVRRGAPLITLDAREIKANHARAVAALASAEEAARAAEADARAAEAAVRLARVTHERITGLREKRSATAQEVDQAAAGLSAAEAQLGSAQARIAAANAARDAARASLEAAEIGVSYTVLSAPFDGIVTERAVDPGSMAAPGAPLLTLEDPSMFRLEVRLDEARATEAAVGGPVEILLDDRAASTDGWIGARVSEIARLDPASHSFLVKVDVPSGRPARSGQFGRVRFAGPMRRTLTVPASAILRRGQLTFVFAVDSNGLARLRPITAGSASHDRVEALAGVRDGELVVMNPAVSLADGTRVTADAAQEAAPVTRAEGR